MKHFHNLCDEQYHNSIHFHHIPNDKKIIKLIYTCIFKKLKKKTTNFPVSNLKSS